MSEQQNDQSTFANDAGAETAGLRPESAGGAGLTQEGAPAGFTADVGGAPQTVDNPEELAEFVPDASTRGPMQASERQDREEPEDDRPWVG